MEVPKNYLYHMQGLKSDGTGRHILEHKLLIDKTVKISYLPEHIYLYSEDIQEQIYTRNMTYVNMRIRTKVEEAQDN